MYSFSAYLSNGLKFFTISYYWIILSFKYLFQWLVQPTMVLNVNTQSMPYSTLSRPNMPSLTLSPLNIHWVHRHSSIIGPSPIQNVLPLCRKYPTILTIITITHLYCFNLWMIYPFSDLSKFPLLPLNTHTRA